MNVFRKIICLVIALGVVACASASQLGPTGILGEISKTTIKVMKAEADSPADGKIKIGDQIIPTVTERPVKSLGKWFTGLTHSVTLRTLRV